MAKIRIAKSAKRLLIPEQHSAARLFSANVRNRITLEHIPYVAVPFTEEAVAVLWREGVQVPAPCEFYYDWPTEEPPLESQKRATAALSVYKRLYNTSQMGTGKTRATAYALDYLVRTGKVRKALIVAPLSTLETVWMRELFINYDSLHPVVLYGTRAKRLKLFADKQFNVHIINHDAIHLISEQAMEQETYDMVVVDELSAFKEQRTRRWKALNQIINGNRKKGKRPVPYAVGLTGTPTPNAPTDAWAQCRLITPDNAPRSFVRFRDMTMYQLSQFRWQAKEDAMRTVARAMSPAVRFTRDECFDLPPVTYSERRVELTKEQEEVYRRLIRDLHVELEKGQITAVNSGVKLNKLLQICGGVVYSNDRTPIILDASPRLSLLKELIDEAPHKVLVFINNVHIVDHVYEFLTSAGVDAAKIYGDTPKSERTEVFNAFQHTDRYKVIVAHPRTMSHGLNLTRADTVVWYTAAVGTETYLQACDRISRGGQKHHQHVIHIVSTKAEEQRYRAIRDNTNAQQLLLGIIESETLDAA